MAHDHYYLDSTAEGKNGISADLLYLGSVRDDPNWFNIDHAHDFCEVLYVVKGSGNVEIAGQHYAVKQGDLIIVNPGTVHQEKSNPADPINLVFLAITNFQIEQLPKNHLLEGGALPVINSQRYQYKIESYFSDLITEASSQVDYYDEICSGLVTALIVLILRIRRAEEKPAIPEGDAEAACEQIKNYLDQNYTKEITLDELSEKIYISKHYLSHIFKNETGVSPIKYLINRRIEEASRLLQETDLSITEISHRVGYENPVYFSQIFKRTKGISPLKFRNSNK